MAPLVLAVLGLAWAAFGADEIEKARDAQDRSTLDRLAKEHAVIADKQPNDANALYRLALVNFYAAEVAMEARDKNSASSAAENGIKAAQKAISLKPDNAEYHRILGTLCGQVIPANVLLGAMKYGKCAQEEVNRAIQLDPKSAMAYLSRGVGNYYLPATFGGGPEKAIPDFQRALELNPKLAEAQMWLGVALRKLSRNAEARKAFQQSLKLNPNRVWTRQQLDKTPAQ